MGEVDAASNIRPGCQAAQAQLRRFAASQSVGQGVIPLYFQINVWAARKGYKVIPRQDERTYAFAVTRGA